MSASENVRQVGLIQRGFLLFPPDSAFETLLPFQVIQGDMTNPGEVFGCLSAVDFTGILAKSDVQGPVELRLNAKVSWLGTPA
ncbi:hypothetical protein [Halomonas sp.]|uniref:hypothetical protein n=1 Tax=Halomonas sp. TaxID=1486246 RepID=UPI00262AE115|nr:hypothetical protein [Halomonas sp.]